MLTAQIEPPTTPRNLTTWKGPNLSSHLSPKNLEMIMAIPKLAKAEALKPLSMPM
jgi:hypothetical protein